MSCKGVHLYAFTATKAQYSASVVRASDFQAVVRQPPLLLIIEALNNPAHQVEQTPRNRAEECGYDDTLNERDKNQAV